MLGKPKLFEASFYASYNYYVREFDPKLKTSSIRKLNEKWEYYVPHNAGTFKSLYNPNNKFIKKFAKAGEARKGFSPISPADLVIRELYREENSYNSKPRIFYLDIETRVGTVIPGFPDPDKALEPVCLIQFLDSQTDIIHIIGDRDFFYSDHYLSLPNHSGKTVKYWKCQTEKEIFEKFFEFLSDLRPLVVYAWNGEGFDFPYLWNRSLRLGFNNNQFSPFHREFGADCAKLMENTIQDKYVANIEAAGIHYIDLLRLYKKIVLAPRDSYSLMNISTIELKCKKIEHNEFKTFDDFYLGNYRIPENPTEEEKLTLCYKMTREGAPYEEIQKAGHGQFVYYGVIDTVLIQAIDKKVGLTKLMVNISNKMNSQLCDVLGTTRPWGNAIRNRLYDVGIIINSMDIQVDLDKSIYGGYVREPVTGKQKWVMSGDVNSMYPILAIAGSNMSPETFRFWYQVPKDLGEFVKNELKIGTPQEQNEENLLALIKDPEKSLKLKTLLKKYNLAMAPNGTFYDKTQQGMIPKMVLEIYSGRKKAKKEMIKADQALQAVMSKIS